MSRRLMGYEFCAVLGAREGFEEGRFLYLQNLMQGYMKSFPRCTDIVEDCCARLSYAMCRLFRECVDWGDVFPRWSSRLLGSEKQKLSLPYNNTARLTCEKNVPLPRTGLKS